MREALSHIDRTNFEHAAYAVAMQLGVLALFGRLDFYAALAGGTLLGVGFFIGREHAQAEKRWNPAWGRGTVWSAFDMRRWDWNSRWDLIFPVVACALAALTALALHD